MNFTSSKKPNLRSRTKTPLRDITNITTSHDEPSKEALQIVSKEPEIRIEIATKAEPHQTKSPEEIKETTESEQTTPSSKHSVIMNTNEKKCAMEYGYSLDKRLSKCTPIYSDLHKACFSLSQVVLRHIKFSRGFVFLEDLAGYLREEGLKQSAHKLRNDIPNKIELTPSQNVLKFNYCFNSNLKFDLSVVQPKYMLYRGDTVEDIKKELTFEAKVSSEGTGTLNNNFIKLNLSESEDEDREQHDNFMHTFTFHNGDV